MVKCHAETGGQSQLSHAVQGQGTMSGQIQQHREVTAGRAVPSYGLAWMRQHAGWGKVKVPVRVARGKMSSLGELGNRLSLGLWLEYAKPVWGQE